MARITVEDCLEKTDSQYDLVLLAKERTSQLNDGELPQELVSKCSAKYCNVCSVQFNPSVMSSTIHYEGKGHFKKFTVALNLWHEQDPANNIIPPLFSIIKYYCIYKFINNFAR